MMCDTTPVSGMNHSERQPGPPPKVRTNLTHKLVSEECMCKSLKHLLANLKRYTLLIEGTGNELRPQIILTEKEPWPQLGETIDYRLLSARRVFILATTEDRGTAVINLTTRTASRWVRSQEIHNVIESFNNCLKSGSRWGFIRQRSEYDIFTILVVAFVIGALASNIASGIVTYSIWAIVFLYMVTETTIVRLSGPLRIWPKQLKGSARPRLRVIVRPKYLRLHGN